MARVVQTEKGFSKRVSLLLLLLLLLLLRARTMKKRSDVSTFVGENISVAIISVIRQADCP